MDGVIHVGLLGMGINDALIMSTLVCSSPFLTKIPFTGVTRFQDYFLGDNLPSFLQDHVYCMNNLTGFTSSGVSSWVGVVGSSSQARFPEGFDSAAAATQPSPDKSRTMHHV